MLRSSAACAPPAPAHAPYLFIYRGCHRYGPIALTSAASHQRRARVWPVCCARRRTAAMAARHGTGSARPLRAAASPLTTPVDGREWAGGTRSAEKTPCTPRFSHWLGTVHSPSSHRAGMVSVTGLAQGTVPVHTRQGCESPPALTWLFVSWD